MSLSKITNVNLWNMLRGAFPSFATNTSEGTADLFTERGFEQIKNTNNNVLNDFFNLSLRVYLQTINIARAVDRFENAGFGEYYENPKGGYIQRMSTTSVKPVTPAYKGLVDGSSIDPFVVRKPEIKERFFQQNFDYQSLITIPDEFQFKQIFISEYGMSELMGGILEGLQNGYITQLYVNKLEAINKGINSTEYPILDTQVIEIPMSETPTEAELKDFILGVKNVISAMEVGASVSKFNSMNWASVQDISRLKLLVRVGYKNLINVNVLATAFNQERLSLPVDIIEVENFGGLTPYKEAGLTTPLYPVYDKMGSVIGYNEAQGQTSVTVKEEAVFWKDPNESIIGMLADKGCIYTSTQNGYSVEPIRNPRGLYTNYWASSPNNTIVFDHLYNFVIFKKVNAMP